MVLWFVFQSSCNSQTLSYYDFLASKESKLNWNDILASQDVLGRGANKSQRTSTPEKGHVWEDGSSGPRGPHRRGTGPAGCPETPVHAVEGDAQLYCHTGFPHWRHQGQWSSRASRHVRLWWSVLKENQCFWKTSDHKGKHTCLARRTACL